jgi:SAM-dependent methyltransferase
MSVQLFRTVQKNARADGKEAYFRLHHRRYAAILDALDVPAGSRVLEVGVTPGQCTQLLVGAGYRVWGVDLDPTTRRTLWQRLGVPVCQIHLERDPLPFADGSFDCVVFSEVIEHLVYSPLPPLREMRRVLVPGGNLILTTPNDLYLRNRLRALGRLLRWQSLDTEEEFHKQMMLEGDARYTTHSRIYTMRELCWLVEKAGLRVVRQHYVAAWESVGLEIGEVFRHPLQTLAKAALTALVTAIPPVRSMLVVVGERPRD